MAVRGAQLTPTRVARALLGLALVQFALPKFLPLPGVSERWWLFMLEGGSWGRLATLVGGALVAVWGASLAPSGLSARQLVALSALAAVGSRLLGLAGAALLGAPIHWAPGAAQPGALLGLLLVALLYGGGAALAGWVVARAGEGVRG